MITRRTSFGDEVSEDGASLERLLKATTTSPIWPVRQLKPPDTPGAEQFHKAGLFIIAELGR